MKIIRRRLYVAETHDSGMSLIEVIVAIAIVSAIALSSASLAINGSSLASSQGRKQVAVTIASGAMEAASAQTVSTIYSGRAKTAVQAAFAANSTVPGIAAVGGVVPTYAVWDTTVPVPSAMNLPITAAPITLDGTTYTTTTLLGACYQPRTGGDCTTIAGKSSPPATAPAGYVALVRVVVVVRWSPDKTCAASGCFYSATTLLDPSTDLEWVTHG
ncbi:type IV pilus modification PilV family protein [Parafrigoribacterium humi]|uniref:type IV pilus modification PilV family protein n=1 Tax=Parafrigoribacterium humi TaxID=3144664 RepID=UPI0032ED1358